MSISDQHYWFVYNQTEHSVTFKNQHFPKIHITYMINPIQANHNTYHATFDIVQGNNSKIKGDLLGTGTIGYLKHSDGKFIRVNHLHYGYNHNILQTLSNSTIRSGELRTLSNSKNLKSIRPFFWIKNYNNTRINDSDIRAIFGSLRYKNQLKEAFTQFRKFIKNPEIYNSFVRNGLMVRKSLKTRSYSSKKT